MSASTLSLADLVSLELVTAQHHATTARADLADAVATAGVAHAASWNLERAVKADARLALATAAQALVDTADLTDERRGVLLARQVGQLARVRSRSGSAFGAAADAARAEAAMEFASLALGAGVMDAATFAQTVAG